MNELCVGRRVYYPGDMANHDGYGAVVAERAATKFGGATFDVILFDGRTFSAVHPNRFSGLRPWRICDRVHGPGMIDAMQRKAAAVVAERATAEADQKTRLADAVLALTADNPHLTPVGKHCRHKDVAKNIRAAFKRAGIKASVRTETGSMVSSIYVTCNDRTQREQANEIGSKFTLGNFNGSDDSYNYDRFNPWVEAFGGVRYVVVQ